MTLKTLTAMTQTLGKPENDYVIIGEGNTSYRRDEEVFYVKASGQQMRSITEEGFVAVHLAPIIDLLDNPPRTQTEQKQRMMDARLDTSSAVAPSIETSFHAMLLAETGATFVGHTHPTPVTQIMCSIHAETFAKKRVFPDQAVLCGPESVYVPYADPGLPLAMVMRDKVRAFMDKYDRAPHELVLANHGMIALGSSADEVLNITAMCVKAARTVIGALSAGGPVYMRDEDVHHVYNRPDEIYRRDRFVDGT